MLKQKELKFKANLGYIATHPVSKKGRKEGREGGREGGREERKEEKQDSEMQS
jgi:hypothetical protein